MLYRITLLLSLVLFCKFTFAQVTTNPTLPIENLPVSITFDATLGDAGLKDYTGDVYTHTGVITDKSSSSTDWKYVIGTWGDNTKQPKLTRITNNTYSLQISPDIRSFYGVPAGEIIKQMAFVFRSADGTKQTKNILVDVYSSGLNVAFTNPSGNSILNQGANLQVLASSSAIADIRLFMNSNQVASVTGATQLSYPFNASQPGDYWLKVTATSGVTVATDSIFINVLGPQVVQTLPVGAKKGINYLDTQTARLVLWAPFKSTVHVIGEFNNWTPSSTSRMKRDGDYFWLDITGLTSGKEYPFQYLVDGNLKIADPYTEKTSDPDNDKYITSATYPGLIAYPAGKTEGITSVLQTNQQPYNWQIAKFGAVAPDTMVVYECHVRDFDLLHSYTGVISHLDYLKTLGVNVLELMPVNEFEGNSSWGYNPSFYFAPDKYYGPKNDLKLLVDECHKRGIATVLDLVLNHSYGQSPLVQLYFDGSKPTVQNPWYNQKSNFANPSLQWGYDFNHDSPATRQLVDSINSFWMSEYKIDGFRFDFTKGFSNTPRTDPNDWGGSYDQARVDNLERMAHEIWVRKPGAMVIFEHLADNPEQTELASKGILLWGNFNYNASQGAMGYNDGGKSDWTSASYAYLGWTSPGQLGYMESHDEERILYQCLNYGNALGSYDIKSLREALNRAALTAALFIPVPGPKMIWQFEELGYDISINYNNDRVGEKPIHWEYKDNADRALLNKVFSQLFQLKKSAPIFSTTDFSQSVATDIKWIKLNLNGEHVLIVGNFGVASASPVLDFQKAGTWYDFFGQKTMSVATTSQSVPLAAGEYKLFSTQNLGNIVTDVPLIKSQNYLQISPNPASDYLKVISVTGSQKLSIFSLTGVKVKEFQLSTLQGAENNLFIGDLNPGLYMVKAQNINGETLVRKVIKRP
ncbi:MAG: alpha-amylase family glycosyl hydrolase [Mariniphaga sp.]